MTRELESDVSENEFEFINEGKYNEGLDNYESSDDSGADLDGEDENVKRATCKYEANSVGFEFTHYSDNIVLHPRQLFKIVHEF